VLVGPFDRQNVVTAINTWLASSPPSSCSCYALQTNPRRQPLSGRWEARTGVPRVHRRLSARGRPGIAERSGSRSACTHARTDWPMADGVIGASVHVAAAGQAPATSNAARMTWGTSAGRSSSKTKIVKVVISVSRRDYGVASDEREELPCDALTSVWSISRLDRGAKVDVVSDRPPSDDDRYPR
jgi:hypothetical protein